MPDVKALQEYYRTLTDDELLNLKREGGLTEEASRVLRNELTRRKIAPGELKRYVGETERMILREEVQEKGGGYRLPGLQFFGKRYLNEADKKAEIQVRTKWFTLSGIPLVPIASYRFRQVTNTSRRLSIAFRSIGPKFC